MLFETTGIVKEVKTEEKTKYIVFADNTSYYLESTQPPVNKVPPVNRVVRVLGHLKVKVYKDEKGERVVKFINNSRIYSLEGKLLWTSRPEESSPDEDFF